eukprot:gene27752-31351_t
MAALVALALAGCAGEMAFREGRTLVEQNNPEAGLAKFQEAIAKDPQNAQFRSAYLMTRDRTAVKYLEQADRELADGRRAPAQQGYQRVLALDPMNERARAGLFLAMQYPVEVPGVSVSNFLRTAKTAIDGEAPKLRHWVKDVNKALQDLNLDPTFGQRSVNEGFSGGEKKRHEIAQLELLNPKIAVLDETDSGLDIDALKIVSEGVNRFRAQEGKGVLLITHYTRILRYITPDRVHVFVDGKIADQGGPELADALEAEGYDKYLAKA